MISNYFLYDTGFFPTLMDDFGYYLIKKNIDMVSTDKPPHSLVIPTSLPSHLHDVVLVDKKLLFLSTVDSLFWEDGKYRAYINTLRLYHLCKPIADEWIMELGEFMGRMLLGSITKYKYDEWIHADYVMVGSDRVYRATDKQRRVDIQRVHKLHAILQGRDFLDVCTSVSLYPNLKAPYGGVFQLEEEEKKQYQRICEQVCDVSLVWQCGIKRRRFLRQQKIYRWDDPAFPDCFFDLVGKTYTEIIQRMLSLTTSEQDLCFPPKDELVENFPILNTPLTKWVFVDFETDYQKCIYLVGLYTENGKYQCEWADYLDSSAEAPLMHTVYNLLMSLKQKGHLLCYYVAENNFWKERCRLHRFDQYMELFEDALDLNRVFVEGPLLIRGAFNFKLKTIASKLYELGHLSIKQPEGCLDGAQSIDLARQYFQTRSEDISTILEQYNQFDCQVLYELMNFLQKYYNLGKE